MSNPKIGNKSEAWGFSSPKFGPRDSLSLGALATKYMEESYMSYCPEDMYKLNPPAAKPTEEYLEEAFNDDLNVTGLPPMV